MSRQLFIGIDPGAKGALCALDPVAGKCVFFSTTEPPMKIIEWIKQVDSEGDLRTIMIEQVSPVPQSSAGANFKFGYNVGLIDGVCLTSGYMVDRVRPKAWQKEVGVSVKQALKGTARKNAIKKAVAEIAIRLYPKAAIYGPKGGLLDGRSDALMLAHYCYLKHKIS